MLTTLDPGRHDARYVANPRHVLGGGGLDFRYVRNKVQPLPMLGALVNKFGSKLLSNVWIVLCIPRLRSNNPETRKYASCGPQRSIVIRRRAGALRTGGFAGLQCSFLGPADCVPQTTPPQTCSYDLSTQQSDHRIPASSHAEPTMTNPTTTATNSPFGAGTPTAVSLAAPVTPAEALLRRAHPPASAASIFADKIQHKSLALAPTAASDGRAKRRLVRLRKNAYKDKKRRPRPLSAKERRETGVHALKRGELRYEVYRGLHELWNGYMLEVLGFVRDGAPVSGWEGREVGVAGQGPLLASADFHGAEVRVVRCRDTGKLGFKGVVVRDTKFTFVIVMEGDEMRTVMKKGAVFAYEVKLPDGRSVKLEANGDALEYRPAERASRKFKWKNFDV